ncbi:MAG TPA: DsbA family protein [Sporichthyaceae bacterium]|jgi:predicted DsbA family dithiol-disulfide isomerase
MSRLDAVEFTDPACSYAWGTEGKYRRFRRQYAGLIGSWRQVMSGIMTDTWREPLGLAEDDEKARAAHEAYLREVSALTGMPHPLPMHYVMDNSEDACRVAIAARAQGPAVAEAVLRRLRESWFVWGRPADSVERGLAAAAGVPGCDLERLARDVADPATEVAYRVEWEESRRPNEHALNEPDKQPGRGAAQPHNGRMRYGLPALLLTGADGQVTVAGWRDWSVWEQAVELVCPGAVAAARPRPTPAEAFARWPLLARAELDELCGPGAQPPADVVEHRWPGGVIWLTKAEASTTDALSVMR